MRLEIVDRLICVLIDDTSAEEDAAVDEEATVSSASLCMSPTSQHERSAVPLCSSTPYTHANTHAGTHTNTHAHAKRTLTNGHIDNNLAASDVVNGNVTGKYIPITGNLLTDTSYISNQFQLCEFLDYYDNLFVILTKICV